MKSTHATLKFAGDDFFVATPPSGHALTLDFNGERSSAPGPLELLLVALGGCTGADVISILTKKREQVTDYRIEVHGERRDEHPKGFKKMEVKHILRGRGISEAAVKQAIELSVNKYCSVAGTLRPTVEIVSTFEIHEEQ
ncbi:MAG TPA: OsmC family protein [Bryobacteraceae bacterium]|nr:OsmC family protein [Bryobacteraceae bacterium]